jgi:hypothetical protein
MFATANGRLITLSSNIANAFTGEFKGYKVELHALPGWTFHVEASCADEAQSLAYQCARKEGANMLRDSDAATIQRMQ